MEQFNHSVRNLNCENSNFNNQSLNLKIGVKPNEDILKTLDNYQEKVAACLENIKFMAEYNQYDKKVAFKILMAKILNKKLKNKPKNVNYNHNHGSNIFRFSTQGKASKLNFLKPLIKINEKEDDKIESSNLINKKTIDFLPIYNSRNHTAKNFKKTKIKILNTSNSTQRLLTSGNEINSQNSQRTTTFTNFMTQHSNLKVAKSLKNIHGENYIFSNTTTNMEKFQRKITPSHSYKNITTYGTITGNNYVLDPSVKKLYKKCEKNERRGIEIKKNILKLNQDDSVPVLKDKINSHIRKINELGFKISPNEEIHFLRENKVKIIKENNYVLTTDHSNNTKIISADKSNIHERLKFVNKLNCSSAYNMKNSYKTFFAERSCPKYTNIENNVKKILSKKITEYNEKNKIDIEGLKENIKSIRQMLNR
jgi:hypothetical protein